MGVASTMSPPSVLTTPMSFSPHICWARGQAAPYLPWCTLALPTHHSAVPWHSLCGHSSVPCQLYLWGHSPTWPLEPPGPFCPTGTAPHIPGHSLFHSMLSCGQSCRLVHGTALPSPSAPLAQPHTILGTAFSTLPNAAPWARTCMVQGRDVPFPFAPSARDSDTAFSTLPDPAPWAQSCVIQGTALLSTAAHGQSLPCAHSTLWAQSIPSQCGPSPPQAQLYPVPI